MIADHKSLIMAPKMSLIQIEVLCINLAPKARRPRTGKKKKRKENAVKYFPFAYLTKIIS